MQFARNTGGQSDLARLFGFKGQGADTSGSVRPAINMEDLARRLDVVTEILRGWIWETDREHRFVYMSPSVLHFAGVAPEWHYGKTRQELGNLNPDMEEHRRFLAQLDAREVFGPVELVRYQNGRQFWMRTTGIPQFDAASNFTGYCGLAFDITHEVEARQGNRRREQRTKVARAAVISHSGSETAIPCMVLDISQSGARLDVPPTAEVPSEFKLVIDIEGRERHCRLVWRKLGAIGLRFIGP